MAITTELLKEVASVYSRAAEVGDGPTKAVEEAFGVSRSTAGAWIGRARSAGFIEVSPRPRHKRAIAVAEALDVDYDDLVKAVRELSNGRLVIS